MLLNAQPKMLLMNPVVYIVGILKWWVSSSFNVSKSSEIFDPPTLLWCSSVSLFRLLVLILQMSNKWFCFVVVVILYASKRGFVVLTSTLFGSQDLAIFKRVRAHWGTILTVLVGQLKKSFTGFWTGRCKACRLLTFSINILLGFHQFPHLQCNPVAPSVINNTVRLFACPMYERIQTSFCSSEV